MDLTNFIDQGFSHILDLEGYDHILFIFSFSCIYPLKEWKKLVGLITLFTLTHTAALLLAAKQLVTVNYDLIELLIVLTILASALYNIFVFKPDNRKYHWAPFVIIPSFGIIHGLGFSNFFRMITDLDNDILTPFAGFVIGLELGQLIILTISLSLSIIILKINQSIHQYWRFIVSGIVGAFAIYLLLT